MSHLEIIEMERLSIRLLDMWSKAMKFGAIEYMLQYMYDRVFERA